MLSVGVPASELIKDPASPRWRDVSVEFCGGTHVKSTGQIEHFVISSEEAVAKGVRRIVGLTGQTAQLIEELGQALVDQAEKLVSGPPEQVPVGLAELQNTLTTTSVTARQRARLRVLLESLQRITKEQHKAEAADATGIVQARIVELLKDAPKVGDTWVVVAEMPAVPAEQLKHGADTIKQKCGSAAILFGATERRSDEATQGSGKAVLLAAMTPDLIKKGLKAGDLVKAIAPIVGGGGGGPPTMAQAGGKNPEKLVEALEAGRKWITEKL